MYRRYRTMRRCFKARESPTDDEKRFNLLFIAMMATVAAFLLTSTFISVLYYPPFWHLVGVLTAIYRVAVRDVFPDAATAAETPRGARLRRA
jgi:Flp pilus assembly protein TadB